MADRRRRLWRLTAEWSHDGLGDLLDDALLAAQEAGLVAVPAQGPQVHPPDGLRGERLGGLEVLGLVHSDPVLARGLTAGWPGCSTLIARLWLRSGLLMSPQMRMQILPGRPAKSGAEPLLAGGWRLRLLRGIDIDDGAGVRGAGGLAQTGLSARTDRYLRLRRTQYWNVGPALAPAPTAACR